MSVQPDHGASLPEFRWRLCPSLAVSCGPAYLSFLCLIFLISEMGIIIIIIIIMMDS